MASQVHPIPYFTPSIFNFPQNVTLACPKMNLAHFQSHQGSSSSMSSLYYHLPLSWNQNSGSSPRTSGQSVFISLHSHFFLKKLSKLTDFPENSASSISAICPGSGLWLRLQTRLLTHLPSSVSSFKSFLMRILKHKPHPVTRLINLFLHPKYPQTSACLNKHTLKWPVPKTSLPKSWSWSHFNQTKSN